MLVLPDVNVWLALSYEDHEHYERATHWYGKLQPGARLAFCRVTHMGLMRLLMNKAVMKDEALSASAAWKVYERWLEEGPAVMLDEPNDLDRRYRQQTPQVKQLGDWTDAYLAAFSLTSGIELITFDKGLHRRVGRGTLL